MAKNFLSINNKELVILVLGFAVLYWFMNRNRNSSDDTEDIIINEEIVGGDPEEDFDLDEDEDEDLDEELDEELDEDLDEDEDEDIVEGFGGWLRRRRRARIRAAAKRAARRRRTRQNWSRKRRSIAARRGRQARSKRLSWSQRQKDKRAASRARATAIRRRRAAAAAAAAKAAAEKQRQALVDAAKAAADQAAAEKKAADAAAAKLEAIEEERRLRRSQGVEAAPGGPEIDQDTLEIIKKAVAEATADGVQEGVDAILGDNKGPPSNFVPQKVTVAAGKESVNRMQLLGKYRDDKGIVRPCDVQEGCKSSSRGEPCAGYNGDKLVCQSAMKGYYVTNQGLVKKKVIQSSQPPKKDTQSNKNNCAGCIRRIDPKDGKIKWYDTNNTIGGVGTFVGEYHPMRGSAENAASDELQWISKDMRKGPPGAQGGRPTEQESRQRYYALKKMQEESGNAVTWNNPVAKQVGMVSEVHGKRRGAFDPAVRSNVPLVA